LGVSRAYAGDQIPKASIDDLIRADKASVADLIKADQGQGQVGAEDIANNMNKDIDGLPPRNGAMASPDAPGGTIAPVQGQGQGVANAPAGAPQPGAQTASAPTKRLATPADLVTGANVVKGADGRAYVVEQGAAPTPAQPGAQPVPGLTPDQLAQAAQQGENVANLPPGPAQPLPELAGKVAPVARPILEYGGLAAGGAIGAAGGIPTGGVVSPVGAVAGAGLGYGLGKKAADALDAYAGKKPMPPPVESMVQSGKDVATGAEMEMAGQSLGAIAKPVGEWLASKAPRLYESALKIPPSVPADVRDKAVQSGIEGKYLPNKKSLDRLGMEIPKLGAQVDAAINRAAKAGTEVNTQAVLDRVDELAKFYKNLPDPRPYLQQLEEAKAAIMEYRGKTIPADVAQSMKRNLYVNLRKSYGEMKSISKEFDKSVARGIKEELETQIPELQGLNKKLADKINLETVLERAVNRVRNYDVIRLGDTVAAAAGAAAEGGPEGLGIGFIVKRVLEAPTVKARLAFALGKTAGLSGNIMGRPTAYTIGKSIDKITDNRKADEDQVSAINAELKRRNGE
jgi:hypothetical protein